MAFHETLPPRLVELLRQAKDQILAAPYAFRMEECAQQVRNGCGTALCILGHMAVLDQPRLLKGKAIDEKDWAIIRWRMAKQNEGLLGGEWQSLFVQGLWPPHFDPNSAESAAARIDYWLETGQ